RKSSSPSWDKANARTPPNSLAPHVDKAGGGERTASSPRRLKAGALQAPRQRWRRGASSSPQVGGGGGGQASAPRAPRDGSRWVRGELPDSGGGGARPPLPRQPAAAGVASSLPEVRPPLPRRRILLFPGEWRRRRAHPPLPRRRRGLFSPSGWRRLRAQPPFPRRFSHGEQPGIPHRRTLQIFCAYYSSLAWHSPEQNINCLSLYIAKLLCIYNNK
ncbi:unnamed protein product, partial [Urochloa humidicola]